MAKPKRRNTEHHVFKVGDLVLAKMKGYPPWPAKVLEIPRRGYYAVKFYYTDQLGKGILELKPWNASIRPPQQTKDKSLLGAYDLCHEEYKGLIGDSTRAPEEVDTEPGKRAKRVKLGKVKAEPKLTCKVNNKQPAAKPELEPEPKTEIEPEPEPMLESEPTSSPEVGSTETELPDRVRSPTPIKFEANDKNARKLNAIAIDCSLNDLTSEQANADRGLKRSSPRSNLAHQTIEIKTIEKLKKKLQRKLDEKEIKKRNRTEKKIFDKASNIWQRKFIPKFLSLSQMCEQFVAKPSNQRNADQLMTSMKSCIDSKNFDLLNKCVEPLGSHYGRTQKESKDYHQVIERMVSCVKKVKATNVRPASKEAKHFLGQLRANPNIKQFINSFKEWTSETKEESIVERKENSQKRRKSNR